MINTEIKFQYYRDTFQPALCWVRYLPSSACHVGQETGRPRQTGPGFPEENLVAQNKIQRLFLLAVQPVAEIALYLPT